MDPFFDKWIAVGVFITHQNERYTEKIETSAERMSANEVAECFNCGFVMQPVMLYPPTMIIIQQH